MQILQSRDGFHVANLTTTEFKAWIALRERKPESSRFDLSMEDAEALSMKIRDEVVRIKSDREKKGDHDDGNL